MKVFCDIGNTYTKILIVGEKLIFKKIIKEESINFLKKYSKHLVYISCVVEEIEKKIRKKFTNFNFLNYNHLKNYIKIKYNKNQLGSDRLISAFVVKEIFGKNSLIISFGTAIVIDYINQKEEYVGGEIFPGISLLLNSLYVSTSKLPNLQKEYIKTLKIKNFLGSNTNECIVKGILNFVISGIKNMISVLKPNVVVISGGDKDLLKKQIINITTKRVYAIEQLVLLGLILWAIKEGILNDKEISIINKNLNNLLT